jgi:outer membrane protein OmpA-like peptidoglycan-associated protein
MLGALGLIVGVGLGVYLLALGGGGETATDLAPGESDATASSASGNGTAEEAGGQADESPSTTIELDDGTVLLPSSNTDLAGTVVDGRILVAGAVPTTHAQAGLVLLLEEVVGVGNVDTENLVIDPEASTPDRIALIVGSEVVFDVGSDQVGEEFKPVLDNLASVLEVKPEVNAVVEGHADNVGSASDNLSLSQRRADAVVEYLAERGIERYRLVAIGRGAEEPVADNSTAEGRARNRRIEFVVAGFRLDL